MKATKEKKMLNLGLKITMSKWITYSMGLIGQTMCKKETLKLNIEMMQPEVKRGKKEWAKISTKHLKPIRQY